MRSPWADQLQALQQAQPGVVVVRSTPRRVLHVVTGRGGRDAALCNELRVPVLFAVGGGPYKRIICGFSEECADSNTAEIALDLARLLVVPFMVSHVCPSSHLGAADPAVEQLVATAEQRARWHRAPTEVQRREGNPITLWLTTTHTHDLLVLPRYRTGSDSFAAPDVALRMVRAAQRSVLVCTRDVP